MKGMIGVIPVSATGFSRWSSTTEAPASSQGPAEMAGKGVWGLTSTWCWNWKSEIQDRRSRKQAKSCTLPTFLLQDGGLHE